jgi:hypothetical protein
MSDKKTEKMEKYYGQYLEYMDHNDDIIEDELDEFDAEERVMAWEYISALRKKKNAQNK